VKGYVRVEKKEYDDIYVKFEKREDAEILRNLFKQKNDVNSELKEFFFFFHFSPFNKITITFTIE
jgi:hypothetical protein